MTTSGEAVPRIPTQGVTQASMRATKQDPHIMLIGGQELIAARPMKEKKFAGDPYTYREWKLMFKGNVDGM